MCGTGWLTPFLAALSAQVELQLKKAVELHDDARVRSREIKLRSLYIDRYARLYTPEAFPKLRWGTLPAPSLWPTPPSVPHLSSVSQGAIRVVGGSEDRAGRTCQGPLARADRGGHALPLEPSDPPLTHRPRRRARQASGGHIDVCMHMYTCAHPHGHLYMHIGRWLSSSRAWRTPATGPTRARRRTPWRCCRRVGARTRAICARRSTCN